LGFFGRRHQQHQPESATEGNADYIPPQPDAICLHTELAPSWDSAADVGKHDKIVAYRCVSCRQSFTPDEAQTLQSSEAERLRAVIELPADDETAGAST
jgi:hypothetical protein